MPHDLSTTERAENFTFAAHERAADDFGAALREGLRASPKALPCRFLYDERGSELFEQICALPEYYPTRTETAILTENADAIATLAGPSASLIELGSGSSTKTDILLEALESPAVYVPIDVSADFLAASARRVARAFPDLRVEAICADYAADMPLPDGPGRRVAFFPGSTIGNLTHDEARALLSGWRRRLGPDGLMIVGVDLKKDPRVLEAAYDDAQGVTEAFIKNMLVRANAELGCTFAPDAFAYEARWREDAGRIEMHLRSLRPQQVRCGAERFALDAGERIHIENSHKYDVDAFAALAEDAGFETRACFTDEAEQFAVFVLGVG
jgi:L-histidine N-alpha-methyltransferase